MSQTLAKAAKNGMSYKEFKRGINDGKNNSYKPHKGAIGAFLTGWSKDDQKKKKSYDGGWGKGKKSR